MKKIHSSLFKIAHVKFFAFFMIIIFSGEISAADLEKKGNLLASHALKYCNTGNYSLAIIYINKAIKIQPERMEFIYQRALILGKAGYYPYAINELSRFVNNKSYSHAVRFRADCYFAMNQIEMAVKDYVTFLIRSPKDAKVWAYFAEALYMAGDKKGALKAVYAGLKIKSHWERRLLEIKEKILLNQPIEPHKPLSN
ncbi:MAG: hypothetical protein RBR08_02660 [Desulforegulaceae bacterium]|nr:hypothetical protein [Desulforegulaceae bacterium]